MHDCRWNPQFNREIGRSDERNFCICEKCGEREKPSYRKRMKIRESECFHTCIQKNITWQKTTCQPEKNDVGKFERNPNHKKTDWSQQKTKHSHTIHTNTHISNVELKKIKAHKKKVERNKHTTFILWIKTVRPVLCRFLFSLCEIHLLIRTALLCGRWKCIAFE